jgi:arylsulfatase A-like enzyme
VLRQNRTKTVSNIDIAPTLIDILGLRENESVKKVYGNYTGQSLFEPVPNDRSVIIMNNNEVARFKVGISLIKGNYHYIHRMNIVPNRQEVYDIKKDKTEKKNLIEIISKKDLKDLMNTFKAYPACDPYLPD